MEAGVKTLLIDEDTSATNFMVRDELMARIVLAKMEPITPFISRVRDLNEKSGISTILVAGSSGAYFHVADTVIQMDRYVPCDITDKIAEVTAEISTETDVYRAPNFREPDTSAPVKPNTALKKDFKLKTKVLSPDSFLIGHDEVDVRGLEQITDREQTAALMLSLKYMELHILDGRKSLQQAAAEMLELIASRGLEVLYDGAYARCGLSEIRPQELFGTLNRYRK